MRVVNLAATPFLSILSRLGWPGQAGQPPMNLLGVTTIGPGHGLSTVASQLALSASLDHQRETVLVDCNFSYPSLHDAFANPLGPGLAEVIAESMDPSEALQRTSHENLQLLTAGRVDGNVRWTEEAIRNSFRSIGSEHDLVVCDIPSLNCQALSEVFLRLMDHVLIVVCPSKSKSHELVSAGKHLQRCGINLAGVVLNRVHPKKGA